MDICTSIHISDNREPEGFASPMQWFDDDTIFEQLGESFIATPESEDKDDERFKDLTPRELGREGERLAATYLTARGYTILERNWRCNEGEVDIICEDEDGTVVLVEVKTRHDRGPNAQVMPELAVDNAKQQKLARLALWYLVGHPGLHSVRFDVIAINVLGTSSARLRHLVGAFSWDE